MTFTSASASSRNGPRRKINHLIFLQPGAERPYFFGTHNRRLDASVPEQLSPVSFQAVLKASRETEASIIYRSHADGDTAFAMQLASVGETDLARFFARTYSESVEAADQSLISKVYYIAAWKHIWDYMRSETIEPETIAALSEIRSRWNEEQNLKEVQLQIDGILDAAVPSTAQTGSDEWLIDQLVYYGLEGSRGNRDVLMNNPYLDAVLQRGTEIVPALLDHLHDRRATKQRGILMSKAYFTSIGDICETVIASLMTSGPVYSAGRLKQTPHEWWESVSHMSEQDILEMNLFPESRFGIFSIDLTNLVPMNQIPLDMICLKYPEMLPQLYVKSLGVFHVSNQLLAYRLSESELPEVVKTATYRKALEDGSAVNKLAAVYYLKDQDQEAVDELLWQAFTSELPPKSYISNPQISRAIARFRYASDPSLGTLLSKSALNHTSLSCVHLIRETQELRRQLGTEKCLALLRPFLDDKKMHFPSYPEEEMKSSFRNDPNDLHGFERHLMVRDYAAWKIGSVLELEVEPEHDWNTEDWDTYRLVILEALEKYDAENPA